MCLILVCLKIMLANKVKCVDFHFRVLKVELDTYKLRVKALQEENRALRQASVSIVSLSLSFSSHKQSDLQLVIF